MDDGDSRRKLFLPWVLRGKHGNPVTREEGSALFKGTRDISKFPLYHSRCRSVSRSLIHAILARGHDTS